MKIILYDSNHKGDDSNEENERAKAVFMSRDDRIFKMAALKTKPKTINFFTNDLFGNNIIGEPEIIKGDVLLVVEQCENEFSLPYALMYNKSLKKPELYIERSIGRAKEVLEANNDICSDIALLEFLGRKGIPESSVWIFSVLVKTKLIKQIWKCIILANAIKRIVNKEVFVVSEYEGKDKIWEGIYKEDEVTGPLFVESITYVIENIIRNNLEDESKLSK